MANERKIGLESYVFDETGKESEYIRFVLSGIIKLWREYKLV